MDKPTVSVVIPAYNKGALISRTIESALAQTFSDYEIIVIDDGSTDNTRSMTEGFGSRKIRYYYQENSGLPAAARNSGIRKSRGEYIAFLDADDVWHHDKLKKCLDIFSKNPDIDLVCHDEVMTGLDGRVIRELRYGPYEADMFRRLLYKGNCLSPSATVVRRNSLLKAGLFREYKSFFAVEDYDLWLRLSLQHRFFFISEVLGEYLIHDGNISSDSVRNYRNQIAVINDNFSSYDRKRLSDYIRSVLRITKLRLLMIRDSIRAKRR